MVGVEIVSYIFTVWFGGRLRDLAALRLQRMHLLFLNYI